MPGEDIKRGVANKNRTSNNHSNNKSNNNNDINYATSSSCLIEDTQTQWTLGIVPMFVVANVAIFIIIMFINNSPKHVFKGKCVLRFLGLCWQCNNEAKC